MDIYKGILECGDVRVYQDELMKKHTTFRIGGVAKYFVEVNDVDSLSKLVTFLAKEGKRFFILGAGSNLLVSDNTIDDIVIIKLGIGFRNISITQVNDKDFIVDVGAGYILPSLSKEMYNYGLSGAEFCIAIPGTLGGGMIMNAGAHGSELKDITVSVYCLSRDGDRFYLTNEDAKFSYRNSGLKDFVVVGAKLRLRRDSKEVIKLRMNENLNYRAATQPKGFSAGSVFKNPPGMKAWKIIKDIGLSGYRVGDVMFSEKHANFIINLGDGRSSDVIELINTAKERARREFGVELELEIKLLGRF